MSPLSNSATTIRDYDNRHYLHPWEAMWPTDGANRTISARAENIYVYTPDGKRLIDGPGGMWCTQIGYGRRDMADAIADQVMRLSYHSPWNTASEPGALLAKKLADLAPGDLNTVFFTTGGSTAVDTALRFVHFYNNRLGRPDKKVVISREKAYHGSTYLAASVTGKERSKSWFDVDGERTHLLPDINPSTRQDGMSLEAWCDAKVADLETAIAEIGPHRVGAFIAEPVLASGRSHHSAAGVPPALPGGLPRPRRALHLGRGRHRVRGRLGHWFASEDVFGIQPDLITCAKGLTSGYLPLGACLIADRVLAPVSGPGQEDVLFANGYTYSGHPVSCAAALKNIEIFESEGILDHVRQVSPHFLKRLHALRESPIVGETRGLGLVGCVEGRLPREGDRLALDREFGQRVDQRCEELGLIVRPLVNMCVFSPPLVISEPQIDEMFDILEQAIRDVARFADG